MEAGEFCVHCTCPGRNGQGEHPSGQPLFQAGDRNHTRAGERHLGGQRGNCPCRLTSVSRDALSSGPRRVHSVRPRGGGGSGTWAARQLRGSNASRGLCSKGGGAPCSVHSAPQTQPGPPPPRQPGLRPRTLETPIVARPPSAPPCRHVRSPVSPSDLHHEPVLGTVCLVLSPPPPPPLPPGQAPVLMSLFWGDRHLG